MFNFEPEFSYQMPFHFGPRAQRGSALYNDVTTIAITYLTDRGLLARYLPGALEVGPEPLLTVSYSSEPGNRMAGRRGATLTLSG